MATDKPSYAQVNRKVWNTCQFRALSREARELFFYLTTCPHGNMLGIFVLRPGYVMDDLQWGEDRERFRKPFDELLDKQLFKYDPQAEVILDMEQLQKHPPINHNQVTATIKIVNSLPKTPLFHDLKLLAESLDKSLAKSSDKQLLEPLIKRLGERFAYSVTVTVTESVTETASPTPIIQSTITDEKPEPKSKIRLVEKKLEEPSSFPQDFADRIVKIREKYQDPQIEASVLLFVNAHSKNAHPDDMIYCLDEFIQYGGSVESLKIKIYLEQILLRIACNRNEAEFISKATEDKGTREGDKKALENLGDILNKVLPVIPAEKPKPPAHKPAAPEIPREKCIKCKDAYIPQLLVDGLCIFCNERIVTVKCPGCTRTVGKNILNKESGLCHHCQPKEHDGRI